MNWQPIETAPKDGTTILVFNGPNEGFYTEPGRIGTASYQDYTNLDNNKWYADDCCDGVTTYNPTHWMPLPAPPTTDKPNPLAEMVAENQAMGLYDDQTATDEED